MPSVHSFFSQASRRKALVRALRFARLAKAYAKHRRMGSVYNAAHNYHRKRHNAFVLARRSRNVPVGRFLGRVHSYRRHHAGVKKTRGLFKPWYKSKFKR